MALNVIDRIFDYFDRCGSEYYGEDATQLQHALQVADLARQHGCTEAMVAASLLHDVGRFMEDVDNDAELDGVDTRHEICGAALLNIYFGKEISDPVRLHVAAKRYLCAVEPDYLADLSRASILSLGVQGGPMSLEEIRLFEAEPRFADAITLRRFDDLGKRPECEVPDLASYRPLLESLLIRDP